MVLPTVKLGPPLSTKLDGQSNRCEFSCSERWNNSRAGAFRSHRGPVRTHPKRHYAGTPPASKSPTTKRMATLRNCSSTTTNAWRTKKTGSRSAASRLGNGRSRRTRCFGRLAATGIAMPARARTRETQAFTDSSEPGRPCGSASPSRRAGILPVTTSRLPGMHARTPFQGGWLGKGDCTANFRTGGWPVGGAGGALVSTQRFRFEGLPEGWEGSGPTPVRLALRSSSPVERA